MTQLSKFFTNLTPGFVPNVVDVAFGLGTIVSLIVAVKIPWNHYFRARETRIQLEAQIADGVQVVERDRTETIQMEKWLLGVAIGVHIVGAGFVYGISHLTGGRLIKPHAALIFLGSIVIRPILAAHAYVKNRLDQIRNRTVFPESEISLLRKEISVYTQISNQQNEKLKTLTEHTFPQYNENLAKLNERVEAFFAEYPTHRKFDMNTMKENRDTAEKAISENKQKLDKVQFDLQELINQSHQMTRVQFEALATKFEETARQLSPDKQMLFGIQEFLNLVRANLFKDQR